MTPAAKSNRAAALARLSNKASKAHAAHPDDPSDSSVQHVSDGVGYPAGEYDVTTPGTDPAFEKDADEITGLPLGTIIEHEAKGRWRVHVPGRNQWGHGTTITEAIDDYFAEPTRIEHRTPEQIATDEQAATQAAKDADATARARQKEKP